MTNSSMLQSAHMQTSDEQLLVLASDTRLQEVPGCQPATLLKSEAHCTTTTPSNCLEYQLPLNQVAHAIYAKTETWQTHIL